MVPVPVGGCLRRELGLGLVGRFTSIGGSIASPTRASDGWPPRPGRVFDRSFLLSVRCFGLLIRRSKQPDCCSRDGVQGFGCWLRCRALPSGAAGFLVLSPAIEVAPFPACRRWVAGDPARLIEKSSRLRPHIRELETPSLMCGREGAGWRTTRQCRQHVRKRVDPVGGCLRAGSKGFGVRGSPKVEDIHGALGCIDGHGPALVRADHLLGWDRRMRGQQEAWPRQ